MNERHMPLLHSTALLLKFLWAFPLTMVGLAAMLMTRIFDRQQKISLLYQHQYVLVFIVHGRLLATLLQLHPWGAMQALALGNCIISRDAKAAQETLLHELVHVQQAMCWGPLFPLVYLFASAWALVQGGCPYRHNRFERAAYAAEEATERPFQA